MNKSVSPQDTGANAVGHKSIVSAVATALFDLLSNKGQLPPLDKQLRIDGKVCLVTGASSGLGKAVAIQLAQRGGHVIMLCRNADKASVEAVKHASGNSRVELLQVDLADMQSVHRCCDQMRERGIVADITVLNAGLMPLNARPSAQGHDLMFAVHFLANRVLLDRWLKDGVIRPATAGEAVPRVIFVSSEAHQSSTPIDFAHFGAFIAFGMKDGMKHYAMSKLHMSTFALELSRRLNPEGQLRVAVHSLCPGPIDSNIARESPALIKPILGPIMKWFFRSPEQAAAPLMLLACAPEMGTRSGIYLHMLREKAPSAAARDTANGQRLWDASQALLEAH